MTTTDQEHNSLSLAPDDQPIEPVAVARVRYYQAKRDSVAGELADAERDLEAAAIDLVLRRLEVRIAAIHPDELGMIDFGGRWLERERILPGVRRLLLDDAATLAAPPTVSLKRSPIHAPLHDEPPLLVPICSDVVAFSAGELTVAQADLFREHLPRCAPCQASLSSAVQVEALFSGNEPEKLTLDRVYPITAKYLATLRDIERSPFERIDAARWLIGNGFGDHHLLDIDVRAAARGELPRAAARAARAAAPTPPAGAAAVRDAAQVVRAELDTVLAELVASGEVLVACQPMYDRVAARLAARVGRPVVITQDGVPPAPGDQPKMRVRALGVEIVR